VLHALPCAEEVTYSQDVFGENNYETVL